MRKYSLFILSLVLCLTGCFGKKDKSSYMRFQDNFGIAVFSKPPVGRTVSIVFLPFTNQTDSAILKTSNLDLINSQTKNGVLFNTTNSKVISKLYSSSQLSDFKNPMEKRDFYFAVVKVHYSVDEGMFKKNEISDGLISYTLNNKKGKILVNYYFSHLNIDDILIE